MQRITSAGARRDTEYLAKSRLPGYIALFLDNKAILRHRLVTWGVAVEVLRRLTSAVGSHR